jgi:type IV pilus assembly protein PilM
VQSFQGLVGSQVLSSPIFKENAICYGICYGLTLQGLGKPGLHTNLLPKEIVKDRLVKQKKPWAVAAAALLLLGCGISFGAYALAMNSVEAGLWKSATEQTDSVIAQSNGLKSEANTAESSFKSTDQIGLHLVGNVDGRIRWLELMRAINQCLPRDEKETTKIADRNELHVRNMECQYSDDVSAWFSLVKDKKWYFGPDPGAHSEKTSTETPPETTPDAANSAALPTAGTGEQTADQSTLRGPKGPGWIVKLEGYHYHNEASDNSGAQFVRNTLINNLLNAKVELPTVVEKKPNDKGVMEDVMGMVSMQELGITYPVLVNPKKVEDDLVDSQSTSPEAAKLRVDAGEKIRLQRFDFDVQFCWQPKSPSERHAQKEKESANKPQPAANAEQSP